MAGRHVLFILAASAAAILTTFISGTNTTYADHLMCLKGAVEQRTQTVSIDPDLAGTGVTHEDVLEAMRPWNDLFARYHGMPVFAEHRGNWYDADILITAHHGWKNTWVSNRCIPNYVQRGANHSVVYLGKDDAWRNRDILPHELGHTLGLGDHGSAGDRVDGHIGFAPCTTAYMGVMSYCTSRQSWFLDLVAGGITLDGQLVQRYWSAG